MTAAAYSLTRPLQAKRVWHSDAIDRLLLRWPIVALATGATLLWLFGLAVGAAVTFGLLAGCMVAFAWTFVTLPYARLRDGLKTYEVARTGTYAPRQPRPRQPTLIRQEETIYLIARYYH